MLALFPQEGEGAGSFRGNVHARPENSRAPEDAGCGAGYLGGWRPHPIGRHPRLGSMIDLRRRPRAGRNPEVNIPFHGCPVDVQFDDQQILGGADP